MSLPVSSDHPYRLDPRTRCSGIKGSGILGWMLVIFSPFIGFAIHGKVAEQGLSYALLPLIIGLGLIVRSGVLVRREWLAIPAEIRAQAHQGLSFLPLPAVSDAAPLVYLVGKTNGPVQLRAEGVDISQKACMQSSWKLAMEQLPVATLSHYEGFALEYIMHIPWSEIECWSVKPGDESPDYYHLAYKNGQYVTIRRPRKRDLEPQILDYVRSVGQCPVRLFDDAGA